MISLFVRGPLPQFRFSEVLLYPTKEGCGSDSVGEYPIREVVDLTV